MSTTKKEPGVAAMIIVLSVICLVVAALLGIINGKQLVRINAANVEEAD